MVVISADYVGLINRGPLSGATRNALFLLETMLTVSAVYADGISVGWWIIAPPHILSPRDTLGVLVRRLEVYVERARIRV